ncbi:basic secretory protein-like protein [Roseateles sp. BYS180W]|uniref:Basic secretory protein-like protein n=1 Tax=Roseateles rivi TaxID=3299028 RepID=A0ABW7FZF6_9BURK
MPLRQTLLLWAALLGPLPSLAQSPAATPAAWAAVSTPEVVYKNDGSPGAELFKQLVPDAQAYILAIGSQVVQTLYRHPSEVPAFGRMELRIERWQDEPKGIAWKAGSPAEGIVVNVNAFYLERYAAKGGNVAQEVRGILFHEMTHAYQHYEGMAGAALEGVADWVRFKAGYQPESLRKPGGHWTDGYKTTSFFFAWLETHRGHADFAPCFNATAKPSGARQVSPWSWEAAVAACTGGAALGTLWQDYQAWLAANAAGAQR